LDNLPKVINRIRDTVAAGLGDLLQGAFDAVDDSLFELANNARSNNEQNRFFEAMREIRIKRKGIERQFQQSVRDLFLNPPSASAQRPESSGASNPASLSLVENDDLEEQVALNAMAAKARAQFQGSLLQLQVRFSEVYPSASESNPVNPLAPDPFCQAFGEAAQALEIQIRERLIVFKQFERYVMSNLGMLIDEANRLLIHAGVIPNFRYQGRKAVESRGKPGQSASAGSEASGYQDSQRSTANTEAQDEQFFSNLHTLFTRVPGPFQTYASQNDGRYHLVNDVELLRLLSSHLSISNLAGAGAGYSPDNLSDGEPSLVNLQTVIEQLLAKANTEAGKQPRLGESNAELINLVALLFEFILEDDNLSPPIQVLISRLQIPILKTVLADRTFFSRTDHPARRLLNALARAGIGWSQSDEKSRDKLYARIHQIVARIIEEFDGDISLYEELNEEFDQFLARENRKATLVEQRTRESERGRIKSQKAQETVDQLLKEKLEIRRIPDSVRDILVNGWSRVMFLAYLRDDAEHGWTQCVRVVDDLLWCLNPHLEDGEREQWVKVVPGLLKALRSGLEEVSYNSSRLDEMMKELKHELTETFRNHSEAEARSDAVPSVEPVLTRPAVEEPSDSEPSSRQPTAIERQKQLEDAAIAQFIEQINALEVGQWVEFALINGTSFRCKLSAIIQEADSFVFVNRMGLKVIEKSRADLAHEMRRRRMTILEQGALVDRALDAVIGSLRRKSA